MEKGKEESIRTQSSQVGNLEVFKEQQGLGEAAEQTRWGFLLGRPGLSYCQFVLINTLLILLKAKCDLMFVPFKTYCENKVTS